MVMTSLWGLVLLGLAYVARRDRWWRRARERTAHVVGRAYPWLDRQGQGPSLLLFVGLVLVLGGLASGAWWSAAPLGVGALLIVVSVDKRDERRAAEVSARFEALARSVQASEATVRADVTKAAGFLRDVVHDAVDEILDNSG